jgi:ubiquitin thioesterase ZRANB1
MKSLKLFWNNSYDALFVLELEDDLVINWSLELTVRLGSRLYALWNRTAGDCLLDSVLQATWGVFDSENTLRQALSESINDGAMM